MSRFSSLFDRIDLSSIYSQHLSTFYHYEKRKFYNKTEIPFSDKILFIFIPILLSILFVLAGLLFDQDYVNITLTCLSIFAGLLFGLLTMVFGLLQEQQQLSLSTLTPEKKRVIIAKYDLTKHLFINIGFSIVLSVLALIAVLFTQFKPLNVMHLINSWMYYDSLKNIYLYLINGISFFLIIEFLLTLMMIIRRFTVLFMTQISEE